MTNIKFLKVSNNPPEIKQSRLKRDWMDATHNKHAYQCLPVTTANVLGWEFVLQEDVVVQLDEPNSMARIISGETTADGREQARASIIDMVTFHLDWAIETDENYSTWITGSPNYFHPDADPLSASIPSFWWPDPVDISWRIRTIGKPVTFHAGEPFCFLTIYDNTILENVTVSTGNWGDDKEKVRQRLRYTESKQKNSVENPWTWVKGIKTGIDADGNSIGPPTRGLPRLDTPVV